MTSAKRDRAGLLRRNPRTAWGRFGDRTAVLHCDTGRLSVLNRTGQFLWARLGEPATLDELALGLSRNWSVPLREARRDVAAYLRELRREGLVSQVGGSRDVAQGPRARDAADPSAWSWLRAYAERCKKPLHAVLEITQSCNLRCVHCYNPRPRRSRLTLDEVRTVIADLSRLGCMVLTVTGGEPMTHPNFLGILEAARGRGLSVILKTSGTLLTPAWVGRLRSLAASEVHLSLYSGAAEAHDRVTRSPGSWEKTVAAARALREVGIAVRLSCPLMRETWPSAAGVAGIAKDIGATRGFDFLITRRLDGDGAPLPRRLAAEDLAACREDEEFLSAVLGGTLREAYDDGATASPDPDVIPCSAGHNLVAIGAFGDVYPCIAWPEVVGNVRDPGGLRAVWRGAARLQAIRGLRNHDSPACAGCAVAGSCSRCPGFFFTESGSATRVAPALCRVTRFLDEAVRARRVPLTGGIA